MVLLSVREFWKYLYDKIINVENIENNSEWPYYDSSLPVTDVTSIHCKEKSSKYFNITGLDDNSEVIVVQLYWEKPNNTDINDKNGIILNAEYKLFDNYSGDVLVKTKRKYVLSAKGYTIVDNGTEEENNQSGNNSDPNGENENGGQENNNDELKPLDDDDTPVKINLGQADVDILFSGKKSDYNGTASFTVNNLTSASITDWKIILETTDEITNFWEVKISNISEGKYLLEPYSYNNIIGPNGSITFGFNAVLKVRPRATLIYQNNNTTTASMGKNLFSKGLSNTLRAPMSTPIQYEKDTKYKIYDKNNIVLWFQYTNSWNNGYTGEVYIDNNTGKSIESWRIKYTTEDTIESNNLWSAVIVKKEGSDYYLQYKHNQDIDANFSGKLFDYNASNSFSKIPSAEMLLYF